ncbi:hypothetical protein [Bilifractor porci]|uniref:WXG100 family type VII secretion target n=1 Tax=Bilifractor porci TaxID=2606636 RepID=A0A7X2P9R3_9FIRM|nr:hypothetical protein [Bilifractor porci]MST82685.1 hypothetical protein [Bilifractor porci]
MSRKTLYEIDMDFRAVEQQVDGLKEIAQKLKNLGNNDFEETLRDIGVNWTGDNAAKFVAKGSSLKTDLIENGENIMKIAHALDEAARNMYHTELQNIDRADDR